MFGLLIFFIGLVTAVSNPFINETMETGKIKIKRGEIFYWFFGPRNNDTNAPIVMWLTGGPGCSSSTALFFENGPYNIKDDAKNLTGNPYSWNDKTYLLFVDQPVGTGFSTQKNFVVNEQQIREDMAEFIKGFMEGHKNISNNEFYVTGESYAGHYVPAIGAYFAKNNIVSIKGVAIGNGLVSPYYQYAEYANYAYEHKKLNGVTRSLSNIGFYICQGLIYTKLWPLAQLVCQMNLMFIMGITFYPFFNPYNIEIKCEFPPLCYNFSRVSTFLNNKDIQTTLKVDKTYQDCNMIVHTFLLADWWFDFADDVRYMLDEKKLKVMVYSGDLDFVCNWRGGEAWVNQFNWTKTKEFKEQKYKNWNETYSNWHGKDNPAEYKILQNLSFIRVIDAGHMVPMDKPQFSLDMLNEFVFRGIK